MGGKVGRTGGASLLSPPLHASLYPQAAQPQPEGLPSPDQGGGGHTEDEWKNIQVLLGLTHGTRTCIKRQKIAYGNFFYFWADEYIYKRIPEDENPPMKGF